LVSAESAWLDQGAKGRRQFYHEVRETREFSIEDIHQIIYDIYGVGPIDFASVKIKQESSAGMPENVELTLKPEISLQVFGHQVSFEFTVEGKITKSAQSLITNLSRTDYYDDGDIRGESLADYDRVTEQWVLNRAYH
jgi:hypothetical protein